ncbi:hypothetical protein ACH4A3_29540 [Streptomyces sp. NPDC018007]|uniref:hypothetical protein n=1 Tax=Streptomyces sp. NPDC018007 TaxID=3365029 RepID=UPI0037A0FBE8
MKQHAKQAGVRPPDLAAVQSDVDHALSRRTGLPPRSVINAGTDALVQHLRGFMAYEYGMDRPESGGIAVATLRQVAERNLDVPVRPTDQTDHRAAYTYWNTLATLTLAFRDLYVAHVRPADPKA